MDGLQAKHHIYAERETLSNTAERISDLVDWMINGCDLGLILLPEPDNIAHQKGVDAAETKEKMKQNDGLLKALMDGLSEGGIADITNVIVVGDHGMVNHNSDHAIYLSDWGVRLQHLGWITGSLFTSGMLFPHDQYFDRVSTSTRHKLIQ